MEKLEWRETFHRQPAQYLFLDLTAPMSVENVNIICQVLQNVTVLSVSLKGSPRFSILGIYTLSAQCRCILPLQSVKHNFNKFWYSVESLRASYAVFTGSETFEHDDLIESLQDAVQQYETYFQGAVLNKDEWPQLQLVFFTAQPTQKLQKIIQESLSSIQVAYIRKVHVIKLREREMQFSSTSNATRSNTQAEHSPSIFENEEMEDIIRSLLHVTEVDANPYQIESIIKCWLHDYSTDSEHLRLIIDTIVLRCDIKECLLNIEALPASGQFFLFTDGPSQNVARMNPMAKQQHATKVPIYTLEAVALIKKEGLCESLVFGHPFIATATRCWKMDWEELESNQQQFSSVIQCLLEKDAILVAKKQTSQIVTSDKTLPSGHFALYPSRNSLLLKSIAVRELLLPLGEILGKDVPEELEMETRKCMENLEREAIYNPLSMTSGLYTYLSTSMSRCRARPSTSFVTPIIPNEEEKTGGKKRKKCAVAPVAELSSTKNTRSKYVTDFMKASAMLKQKFPEAFD